MSPERAGHARKAKAQRLDVALRERHSDQRVLPCRSLTRTAWPYAIDTRNTVYEPDACVRCWRTASTDAAIEINDPVIVVEVVSPSSQSVDVGAKLDDYFPPSFRAALSHHPG